MLNDSLLCLFRGSACSSEMIIQKKKSNKLPANDMNQTENTITVPSKNILGNGSSNESLGNPVQTIGKKIVNL